MRANAAPELRRYLRKMEPEQRVFVRVQRAAVSANDFFDDARPDERWDRAARVFRESRDAYEALRTRLAVIAAPAELAAAHDGLVRSLALFARYVDGYADALATRRRAALTAWSERSAATARRMVALRRAWRRAVLRYARAADVDAPAWVRRVGVPVGSGGG